MQTKSKPKWGWNGAGTFPLFPFSEKDFETLAKIIEVECFSENICSRLTEAAQEYFINNRLLDNAPRSGEIKSALETVKKNTRALVECLSNLDLATQNILFRVSARRNLVINPEEFEKFDGIDQKYMPVFCEIIRPSENINSTLERCLFDAKKINQTARKALIEMGDPENKDPGGPTKKRIALRIYISNLKEIFEETTGRKTPAPFVDYFRNQAWNEKDTYSGVFLDFVSNCLNIIDIPIKSSALASQIKRVFLDTQ